MYDVHFKFVFCITAWRGTTRPVCATVNFQYAKRKVSAAYLSLAYCHTNDTADLQTRVHHQHQRIVSSMCRQ